MPYNWRYLLIRYLGIASSSNDSYKNAQRFGATRLVPLRALDFTYLTGYKLWIIAIKMHSDVEMANMFQREPLTSHISLDIIQTLEGTLHFYSYMTTRFGTRRAYEKQKRSDINARDGAQS